MQSKNSAPVCSSKYCPANSSLNQGGGTNLVPSSLKKDQTDAESTPIKSIDANGIGHNRRLRQIIDERQRRQEDKSQFMYQVPPMVLGQSTVQVSGATEASKIRLILMLGKLQALGVDYTLLSGYFTDCLKKLDQNSSSVALMTSLLVYERSDLTDSNACYNNAVNGIKKTRTTDFSVGVDMINGLGIILQDLK